jgi:hypothetical protein
MSRDFSNTSNSTMTYIWPGLIRTAADAEHDRDHDRRAEILADIDSFKHEWARRDQSPLDGSTWPIGPRRFHAETDRLRGVLKRSQDRGPQEAAATAALETHLELGRGLGYVAD